MYQDSGWQHIPGNKRTGTQYFLRTSNASEDIFSDEYSRQTLKNEKSVEYENYYDVHLMGAFSEHLESSDYNGNSFSAIGIRSFGEDQLKEYVLEIDKSL